MDMAEVRRLQPLCSCGRIKETELRVREVMEAWINSLPSMWKLVGEVLYMELREAVDEEGVRAGGEEDSMIRLEVARGMAESGVVGR